MPRSEVAVEPCSTRYANADTRAVSRIGAAAKPPAKHIPCWVRPDDHLQPQAVTAGSAVHQPSHCFDEGRYPHNQGGVWAGILPHIQLELSADTIALSCVDADQEGHGQQQRLPGPSGSATAVHRTGYDLQSLYD
jgi:hypothetical protein